VELAELIRSGQTTSTEVVKAHFAQMEKHNPALEAVIIVLKEQALETAAKLDADAQQGNFKGPLHGVPMTIKEQFWLKGTKSTLNSKRLKDWVADEDAEIVRRLKDAGAVILGKTNVAKELMDYQLRGDIYPEGKNPYDPACTPGGSSGGSAAALASGMVPIELGGDFGGSIRIPSNYCGVYGLKPTENSVHGHGNVPKPVGAKSFVFHMAQAGPMARTVEDMELVWDIIRGAHATDRTTPRIEYSDASSKTFSDYRVGWVDGWPAYTPGKPAQTLIRNFVQQLAEEGFNTEEAMPPEELHSRSLALYVRLFPQLISQDVPGFIKPLMKLSMKQGLLKGLKEFRSELNQGFKGGMLNYSETMGIRAGITREWESFFERYDILVCPMSYGPTFERRKMGTPFSLDGQEIVYSDYVWPYVGCFNASGHPGMNIPLGLNEEGLPVGVQIVGPYWSEPEMIQFAKLISSFTDGFVAPAGYQP
jgi:amidase